MAHDLGIGGYFRVTTVENIIQASSEAMTESLAYKLYKNRPKKN